MRTFTSLCCILFLCFFSPVASEDESEVCTVSGKKECKPVDSLTHAINNEEAGHGLELLQFKGSRVSSRNCPPPNPSIANSFHVVGKSCPEGKHQNCLLDNAAHQSFTEAWERCGKIEECGAVMAHHDGKFYLRRTTDPDYNYKNVKLFSYFCQAQVLQDKVETEKMSTDHYKEKVQAIFEKATSKGAEEMQHTLEMPSEIARLKQNFETKIHEAQSKASKAHKSKAKLEETMKDVIISVTAAVNKLREDNDVENMDEGDLEAAEEVLDEEEKDTQREEEELLQLQQTELAQKEEDLLQLQQTELSTKNCPVPDTTNAEAFVTLGKECPGKVAKNCLDGNKAYNTLAEAWERCSKTVNCGSVMSYRDGRFYLRRTTDPDFDEHKGIVQLFTYACQATEDRQAVERVADGAQEAFETITEEGAGEIETAQDMPAQINRIKDSFDKKIEEAQAKADDAAQTKAKLEETIKEVIHSVSAAVLKLKKDNTHEKTDEFMLAKAEQVLHEAEKKHAAEKNNTMAQYNKTKEEEGLLQETSQQEGGRRTCPLPDTTNAMSYQATGKRCPTKHVSTSCIDANKGYKNLVEAWQKCGANQECGGVMHYHNGEYYLRRLTDPDDPTMKMAKFYTYSCQKSEEQKDDDIFASGIKQEFQQITEIGQQAMQQTKEMPSQLDRIQVVFDQNMHEARTRAQKAAETKERLQATMKDVIHSVTAAVMKLKSVNDDQKIDSDELQKARIVLEKAQEQQKQEAKKKKEQALLQFAGSRASGKICPIPDARSQEFATVGKGCPDAGKVGGQKCLEGNKAYHSLSEAWERCGVTASCSAILEHTDGHFYMRRASDPDEVEMKRAKLYHYRCAANMQEASKIATLHGPSDQSDHLTDQLQDQFKEITEVGAQAMQETKEMPSQLDHIKANFEKKIVEARTKAYKAAQTKTELEKTMKDVIRSVTGAVMQLREENDFEKEEADALKEAESMLTLENF